MNRARASESSDRGLPVVRYRPAFLLAILPHGFLSGFAHPIPMASLNAPSGVETYMLSDTDEAIYRKIVELSQEGICVADDVGRFRYVNPRFAEMLQYPAAALIGRRALDLLAPEDRPAFEARYLERREGTYRIGQTEMAMIRADGSLLRVLSTTTTLYEGEHLSGVLCMITDREAEVRQRNDLTAHLAAANEEVQTFTYSVSHDLRAPLRAIDGFAHELQLDPDSTLSVRGAHYLDRIRAGATRMRDTIDSLLDLATASRRPLQREQVDLSAIARSIVSELVDESRAVTFDIAPRVVASGDPHLLRIVLDNLLGNAVKFTAKKPAAHIGFDSIVTNDGPVYRVRDDGAGFDPRYSAQLFTPFRRLHSSSEFEGSGDRKSVGRERV